MAPRARGYFYGIIKCYSSIKHHEYRVFREYRSSLPEASGAEI